MYISTQNALFKIGFGMGMSVLESKKENFDNYTTDVPQSIVETGEKIDEICMNQPLGEPAAFDCETYNLFPLEKL
jgi:hypothetical protein